MARITQEWRREVAQLKADYDGKDHEDGRWPKDFWEFLLRNERVYDMAYALTVKATQKRDHFSISTIWHVIRWYTEIEEAPDDEPFKLNNDWCPYIGRLIMWEHEEIANDFFSRRILRRPTRTLQERERKDDNL